MHAICINAQAWDHNLDAEKTKIHKNHVMLEVAGSHACTDVPTPRVSSDGVRMRGMQIQTSSSNTRECNLPEYWYMVDGYKEYQASIISDQPMIHLGIHRDFSSFPDLGASFKAQKIRLHLQRMNYEMLLSLRLLLVSCSSIPEDRSSMLGRMVGRLLKSLAGYKANLDSTRARGRNGAVVLKSFCSRLMFIEIEERQVRILAIEDCCSGSLFLVRAKQE
ncbi:hypothetical protein VNO77_43900 [Canavalia gladiata]|uniref:Uncharacterized protein n=1 Tax=Canavalia gladiata TaxID=3824 RepID=A0AAN9JXL3_CANGL